MRYLFSVLLLFACHVLHAQVVADSVSLPQLICPDCTDTSVANSLTISTGNVALFHIVVYNRWGQTVFESRDRSITWNGKMNNTGENCKSGLYMYTLNYMPAGGSSNNYRELKGAVTLMWKEKE